MVWAVPTLLCHRMQYELNPERRTECDCLQPWGDLLRLGVHDGDERGDEARLQRRQRLGRRLRDHLEHVLRQRRQHRV